MLHKVDMIKKKRLWDYFSNFMRSNVGEYIIFGDFNVVRDDNERSGSVFCQAEANEFNNFLIDMELVDVPMGGRKYSRVDRLCSKMLKLDIFFFITNGFSEWYSNLVGLVLPRLWSDHSPIVLKNENIDYGPTPFKLFRSLLLFEGFDNTMIDAWSNMDYGVQTNNFIIYKNKI